MYLARQVLPVCGMFFEISNRDLFFKVHAYFNSAHDVLNLL